MATNALLIAWIWWRELLASHVGVAAVYASAAACMAELAIFHRRLNAMAARHEQRMQAFRWMVRDGD